ncbi:MAG: flagellar FliJ family protein [Propionibacteriales bacterium]|nr:flagellar FliJ family protein [Propionibacteriales bacterium]
MSGPARDAGMRAVARVRSVREQDSRIGLQQALAEQRRHEAEVSEVRARIERTDVFAAGSAASFLALRASLDALGQVLRTADQEVATSRTISEAAYGHWQQDKARLSAVEVLLERRDGARRAEAARREARDLDEVAARMWQRGRP